MNKKINATKNTSIYLSVLGGISSLGHGIFEILQGNMPTSGLRFEAISQAHRFWEHGGEPALSIIPNYLITGILTTIISLATIIWAITYIDKKVGLWGLIILTIFVLIFGGGFAPPTFMILAIIAASKINKSLFIGIEWIKFRQRVLSHYRNEWSVHSVHFIPEGVAQ